MDKSGSISGSSQVSPIRKKKSPTKSRKPKSMDKKIDDERIIRSTKILWKKELIEVVNIISYKKYNLFNTFDNEINNLEENKVYCKCSIF